MVLHPKAWSSRDLSRRLDASRAVTPPGLGGSAMSGGGTRAPRHPVAFAAPWTRLPGFAEPRLAGAHPRPRPRSRLWPPPGPAPRACVRDAPSSAALLLTMRPPRLPEVPGSAASSEGSCSCGLLALAPGQEGPSGPAQNCRPTPSVVQRVKTVASYTCLVLQLFLAGGRVSYWSSCHGWKQKFPNFL